MTTKQVLGVLILVICALAFLGYFYWLDGWKAVSFILGAASFCGVVCVGIYLVVPNKG